MFWIALMSFEMCVGDRSPGGMDYLLWQQFCCGLQPFSPLKWMLCGDVGIPTQVKYQPDCFNPLQVIRGTDFRQQHSRRRKPGWGFQLGFVLGGCFPAWGKKTKQQCCIMMQAALKLMYQWKSTMPTYLGAKTSYNWILTRMCLHLCEDKFKF